MSGRASARGERNLKRRPLGGRDVYAYGRARVAEISTIPPADSVHLATCVAGVTHFRDLVCWQLARELKLAVYSFLERPHIGKDLRFCDQLREAARSAPRNIAEGFGRRTHADFARMLDIARGSVAECQNHFLDAVDQHYMDAATFENLNSLAARTAAAIAGLQRHLRG